MIVLHIGDPKTGSTAIQSALWHGLGGKRVTPWPRFSANDLRQAFRPGAAPEDTLQRLADWVRSCDTDFAVASSELLQSVSPAQLWASLAERLPEIAGTPGRIRVIAYVRPHAQRLGAAYGQRVKTGLWRQGLDPFIDDIMTRPMLDYAVRFEKWQVTFGHNFTLRPFDPALLTGGDVVTDFFGCFGIDCPAPARRPNDSLKVPALALMRRLQSQWHEAGTVPRLAHLLGAGLGQDLGRHAARGAKIWLSADQLRRIEDRCRADARRADAAFFDTPFLQASLSETIERAPTTAPDLEAVSHFGDQSLREADALGRDLHAIVGEHLGTWERFHRRHRVQGRPRGDALEAREDRIISEAETLMSALAEVMANPDR